MKLLPPHVGDYVRSTAERRVFEALANLPAETGTALHSLNLPIHDYKICGELDFVLLLQDLVLVLEVKGGGVACQGGSWTYTDRYGEVHRSGEGPFAQARSGMFALRDRLTEEVGDRVLRDIAFGFLVVTPDVDLPRSVEWADEAYLGHLRFTAPGGLTKALEAARRFWRGRQPGSGPLGGERHRLLTRALRPDFDKVPSLAVRVGALEATFERLTDEQIERLDVIEGNDRVLCTGGAGTGKTFLALEVMRRAVARGERPLYVCRSPLLASFVRSRLASLDLPALPVFELDALEHDKVDLLVVDEAQDLMTMGHLQRLDDVLAGGLEDGRWTFFYDQNNQARLHRSFDPEAEQLLLSFAPAKARLSRNCRNTRDVVFQTRAVTGADAGVAAAGAGPPVQFAKVEDDKEEAAVLNGHLQTLLADGVRPGEISLVSIRGDWASTSARHLEPRHASRLTAITSEATPAWPPGGLNWLSVLDAKGLEAPFVCVIDLDSIDDDDVLDAIYVAFTRARVGLWIGLRPQVARRMGELSKMHAETALQALGGTAAG
jgi:hypothetical protein